MENKENVNFEIEKQNTIQDFKNGYYNNFELKEVFDIMEKYNIKFKDFWGE